MPRFVATLAALTLAAVLAMPRWVGAQAVYRFEITRANDTSFTFAVGRETWVAPRQKGIAVDPRQRDALVARFEVTRVGGGEATAIITGQTTRVSTEHVAMLEQPPPRWYRRTAFWVGAVLGLLVGAGIGASL